MYDHIKDVLKCYMNRCVGSLCENYENLTDNEYIISLDCIPFFDHRLCLTFYKKVGRIGFIFYRYERNDLESKIYSSYIDEPIYDENAIDSFIQICFIQSPELVRSLKIDKIKKILDNE